MKEKKTYRVKGRVVGAGYDYFVDEYTEAFNPRQAAFQVLRAKEQKLKLVKYSLYWHNGKCRAEQIGEKEIKNPACS